jgi:hypothetical protein
VNKGPGSAVVSPKELVTEWLLVRIPDYVGTFTTNQRKPGKQKIKMDENVAVVYEICKLI